MNTNVAPFEAGQHVICRDVGVRLCLTLGGEYQVKTCAIIGRAWMVQVLGPAGFDLAGSRIWYSARRFVPKKGK